MAGSVLKPADAIAAMVTPEGRQNPYPFYEAIRAHGPMVQVKPGLIATVGYRESTRALRESRLKVQDEKSFDLAFPDWRSHSSLRGFTSSMLYRNPPDHTRMRRLVTGAFTPRRLTAVKPVIEEMTDRLLDRMAALGSGGRTVDLMAEFAFRLPVAVISEMLGVPEGDQVWFRAAAADVMIALEGLTNDELDRADRAADELSAYFIELIGHRRRQPADDLLSALVQIHDANGDRLSQDELVGNLILLLTAGFDTTTHVLGHGALHAIDNPDFAARLCDEPDFVPGYVEEILRFEPPVQATSRWASADVDLLGMQVPADTKVLVMLAAANRDPHRFPRPDQFDPGRRDSQPLTFAGGPHFCVGAPLARIEVQIALPRLLRRFPNLAIDGTPAYRDRWLARGHDWFPVALGESPSVLPAGAH